ncbi:S8 family peptidase [Rhizobium laguerreae]|uniref:S8 family peptidase n=1 Tax=Rhizobium laguerreae TaxID=1076926 RepID=UPI001C90AFB8|nr:S8 family peptidase [Rhizobium laguerreae]
MFAPPELYDPKKRHTWGLVSERDQRGSYVIELNLQHIGGLEGASAALRALHDEILTGTPAPVPLARSYYTWRLSVAEWRRLLLEDHNRATKRADDEMAKSQESRGAARYDPMMFRAIYKLWPDFPVKTQIYRSMPTIKADAALKSYEAGGQGIVWAVVDSGIDSSHPHFGPANGSSLDDPEVRYLHRYFVSDPEAQDHEVPLGDPFSSPDPKERLRLLDRHRELALKDDFGHGTHVAGIIGGSAPEGANLVCSFERTLRVDQADTDQIEGVRMRYEAVTRTDAKRFHGVAPLCKLISLRVLDHSGNGRSSDVIRALAYIREQLNDNPKLLRVHGVNLSVGYEFDAEMFACGQSPLCAEVNRLVQSGVVVVAAAGNTGYGTVGAMARFSKVGLSNTINDPGNADEAITVGATHRDAPHTYGVSYFSSKGPTGDGRIKPDLVAPGERITSCGAGERLLKAIASSGSTRRKGVAYYMEDSGTSMAAPHVSGAIAAFLSIRREFIGKPRDVKRVFTSTATPLGRERYFEGYGLVDLIRAIQSV